MRLQTIKLKNIYPYERNVRKNDSAVDSVIKSIEQCTYVAPIILDENNVILAGHTRYKALKKLGRIECECIVKEGLTEEQKKKYRLLDNKTNELSDWDFDLLSDELEGLDFGDLKLDWGIEEVNELQEAVEDDYEIEMPKEPKAKLGQIYQLGQHRLMCGDSTKQEDIDKLMNGTKVDMLLTDPPYNVAYQGGTKDKLTIKNDDMKSDEFKQFLVDAFTAANNVMKEGAVFYIWHSDTEGYNFRGACFDVGWKVRQCLIWNKNSMVMGRQDYQWKHEPCLYGWKDGASHLWAADRKQTTVLEFKKPTRNAEHPTMKPIQLFDYQIQNNTKVGDIVLDQFGGSGTTIMACEQNGRTGYVMEFDPKYVDVIIDRWEKFTGRKAILIGGV